MLARLGKTLSTNVAIGGLALLVLGAGGASASLTAGHSPAPKPDTNTDANDTEAPEAPEAPDAADAADPKDSTDNGTRPTDTHGYCVSQVAKAAPVAPTGTGSATVNHGTLVRAAAHACGKQAKANKASKANKAAKAHGHGHGRPAAVTPGTTPSG